MIVLVAQNTLRFPLKYDKFWLDFYLANELT